MSVVIHYSLKAECEEAEVVDRLRRLRRKLLKLPLRKVGKIDHLDPIFDDTYLRELVKGGFTLPAEIKKRVRGKWSKTYGMKCLVASPPIPFLIPEDLDRRLHRPARDFAKTTDMWKESDLPESIRLPYGLTVSRFGLAMELASVMLHHGYLMILNPGEGSETVHLALTTMRGQEPPLWLGCGFTKTQYAADFTAAHENVCRILDCVREEGLLLNAEDTCGYYQNRSWKQSAPIVNLETTFAHVMGGAISAAVNSLAEKGVPIKDISNPATKNYNLVQVSDDPPSEAQSPS